jgi:hypothetical protein
MVRIEILIYGDLRESLSNLLEAIEPSITIKPLDEKRLRRIFKEPWLLRVFNTLLRKSRLRRIFNTLRRNGPQSPPAPPDPDGSWPDNAQAPFRSRMRNRIEAPLRVDAVFGLTINTNPHIE